MQKFYDYQIEVEDIYNKIKLYKNRLITAYCPYERMLFDNLILKEIEKLFLTRYKFDPNNREMLSVKEFTIEELAKYDGSSGNPAYVAVNGIVYDVSLSPSWGGGTHFGIYSGKDLTTQFNSCHKMSQILNKLPKIGVIKT